MTNKRTTGTDTARGPASPRSVSGGHPSKIRAVAWSLGPDDDIEADANAWALRHKAMLVSVVVEEEVFAQGRSVWSRAILGELDRAGITHLLTRSGEAKHPNIENFADDLRRDGIEVASLDSSPVVESSEEKTADRPYAHLGVAQRLLAGRYDGARSGLHQSGPAPYGYRREYSRECEDGRKAPVLILDPEESAVVRMIFVEYVRRRSMRKLEEYLDEIGLRTRRRKRWSRAGLSWILKNDTYRGRVHFGAVNVRGQHPPIVSSIVFNKAQALMRRNNRRGGKDSD